MPVDTPSEAYKEAMPKWERCRDAYEGGDAIKAKGDKYLPYLDSHVNANGLMKPESGRYSAYKERALWYNATGRTVDGLAGGIFQKAPKIKAEQEVMDQLEDVTLSGLTAELFALHAAREVLKVGRYGILVDHTKPDPNNRNIPNRPYWVRYRTEDILDVRVRVLGGDETLVRVVLRECVPEDDPNDPFVTKERTQYRVLELIDGQYTQTEWVEKETESGKKEWVRGETEVITRRGAPLTFIPFVPMGPTSTTHEIEKPPLLDLVDVNISHYRTSADLEHGRHFTALPTPWVSGASTASDSAPLTIGSSSAWMLPTGAVANMLEFTGQGLGALERADEEKRHKMAVLGARLLEQQQSKSNVNESAASANLRHAGEQATLKTLAQSLETGLTMVLRWHAWWVSTEEKPQDTGALFELNKEFSTLRMSPEELRAMTEALQGGAITPEEFYYNLEQGGLAIPGLSFADRQAEIEAEKEKRAARMPAPPPVTPEEDSQADGGGGV